VSASGAGPTAGAGAGTSGSGVRRTRVEVGPVAVRTLQCGPADAAEAVVFVHGNPGSADDWEALLGALPDGLRGLSLDLPDFGETPAAPGFAHDVPAYAGFLADALQTLGIARVHLVLHDFGGPIGLVWLAMHAETVASVTLIDTGILPGYRWHRLARIWRTPLLGELFQATATRGAFRMLLNRNEPRGLPRAFVDQMYDHYDRRTRRAVLKLYRATDDPGSAAAGFSAYVAPRDIPALVIWGEGDAYLPAAFAQRQRDAFPSAEVHVLAGSGHWPYMDAPEPVQRLLTEFLERVRGGGAAPDRGA
jgi:pimeloyl-ACP methyl ester carboxylesterase